MNNQDFNALQSAVNRRIVKLTAGGFSGADAVLEKYRNGNVYTFSNVFQRRVIEQACDRLGYDYTRVGKVFIIKKS